MATQMCEPCGFGYNESELAQHLESFHVGPRNYESITVSCGVCRYRVSANRLGMLIDHCALLNHDPREVSSKWKNFMDGEKKRMAELISLGVEMKTGLQKVLQPDSSLLLSEGGTEDEAMDDEPIILNLNSPFSTSNRIVEGTTNIIRSAQLSEPLQNSANGHRNKRYKKVEKGKGEITGKFRTEPQCPSTNDSGVADITNFEEIQAIFSNNSQIQDESVAADSAKKSEEAETPPKRLIEFANLARRPRRKSSAKPTLFSASCKLCSHKTESKWKYMLSRRCILHTFTHKSELYPFKCDSCKYRATRADAFHNHFKHSAGCTTFSNVQNTEMVEETRELLSTAFPDINWDENLPKGKVLGGVQY